jgi:hypothetical protein
MAVRWDGLCAVAHSIDVDAWSGHGRCQQLRLQGFPGAGELTKRGDDVLHRVAGGAHAAAQLRREARGANLADAVGDGLDDFATPMAADVGRLSRFGRQRRRAHRGCLASFVQGRGFSRLVHRGASCALRMPPGEQGGQSQQQGIGQGLEPGGIARRAEHEPEHRRQVIGVGGGWQQLGAQALGKLGPECRTRGEAEIG